ncbi:MAG: FHA domain-containing protein [Bacteroidales bacterium]
MQTLSIGRSASNNIVISDEMVSRHHAEMVILDNGQVVLRDLGSSNGTFVNGNRIKECYLKPGDIVKCATTFFKWAQYVTPGTPPSQPSPGVQADSQAVHPEPADVSRESFTPSDYNLNLSLRYIFTRIFSIGDLFRKDWNMTPSTLFFLLTPVAIVLLGCLILYAKVHNSFAQVVILPVILSIFIFGIPQFITLSLLSINKETSFTKNLFASSIFSFLQFTTLFILGLTFLVIYLFSGGFESYDSSGIALLVIIVYFLAISALISIWVTIISFVYKFFRTVGITKGVSVHLTILTFAINGILMILFTYAYLALILKNTSPFDSILDF